MERLVHTGLRIRVGFTHRYTIYRWFYQGLLIGFLISAILAMRNVFCIRIFLNKRYLIRTIMVLILDINFNRCARKAQSLLFDQFKAFD